MRITHVVVLFLILPALTATLPADTLNVPSGSYPTIQSAINAAFDFDVVLVADGIYTGPGNRDCDFLGKAITVRSASGAALCIIDCQATELDMHRAFTFQNGESPDSVVQGFTIRNGHMTAGVAP